MLWLYNFLLAPFHPLLFLYTLYRRFVQKKSAASFRGQWGIVPHEVLEALEPRSESTPVIWIHAVSVGEVMAARPIARALKREIPHCKIALSVTTDAGFQTATGAHKGNEVEAVFYFPLDLLFRVWRVLDAVAPDIFLAVETELWPNFLHAAHARGVLCFLVNGRVSDNLLKTAPRLKPLWRWMFSNLDGLWMRSEFDAERMKQLANAVGAPQAEHKIETLGDVKLNEVSSPQEQSTLRAKWRILLHIGDDELLWACGSTHPAIRENESGEEEIALRVFQQLKPEFPLRLLMAPRHVERASGVLALCESQGARATLKSQIESSRGDEVIVLDSVGELSEIYAAADVAFVGGSLVSRGGHNVLEPILRGVPVMFGPQMNNFRGAAQFVETEKLGEKVSDENELHARLKFWLEHQDERRQIPERARAALAPHQGASARIAQGVAQQLKSKTENQSSKANER